MAQRQSALSVPNCCAASLASSQCSLPRVAPLPQASYGSKLTHTLYFTSSQYKGTAGEKFDINQAKGIQFGPNSLEAKIEKTAVNMGLLNRAPKLKSYRVAIFTPTACQNVRRVHIRDDSQANNATQIKPASIRMVDGPPCDHFGFRWLRLLHWKNADWRSHHCQPGSLASIEQIT